MKNSQNTTAHHPVRKTADITIIGFLKGKKVKQIKANNIAEMWRKIQEIWAISRECTVTVKKEGQDFMKLWSEKRGEKWWQRNKIVETRRSKGGKKYQEAKAAEAAETAEAIIPKITEEPAEVQETAEA